MKAQISPYKIVLLIILFFIKGQLFSQSGNNQSDIKKNQEILDSIYNTIIGNYVENVDPDKIMKTGVNTMLASLDPFCIYLDEKETANAKMVLNAAYGGIGCVFAESEDPIIVSDVREGYSGFKAGIRAGDTILSIDHQPLKGISLNKVLSMVRGTPGTEVTVTFKHIGQGQVSSRILQREIIKLNAVPYYGMINNSIGYINLQIETKNSSEEVKNALVNLRSKHELKGLIFDLRDNEGGIVSEATKIIGLFLPKGDTTLLEGSIKNNIMTTSVSTESPVDTNTPMIILTNENTISAGEIISGALQDHDRGIIMGEKTFGKGLVQQLFNLPYQTLLKLTMAYYYTPSGRCIESSAYSGTLTSNTGIAVQDSSKKMYRTRNGRIVYSYGGIVPDIKFRSKRLAPVTLSLIQNHLLFDFAIQYKIAHSNISTPQNFHLNGEEYDQFLDYLKTKKLNYQTEIEKKMQELKRLASMENYSDEIKTSIENLQMRLAQNKNNDLVKFGEEIKNKLEEEIIRVYYFEKGRYQFSIENDPEITKAIETINNRDGYTKILRL